MIPHKDSLLILAEIQKEIIKLHNSQFPQNPALPQYPLWAFNTDFPQNFKSMTIGLPEHDSNSFYFPVKLAGDSWEENYKIIFATTTFKITQAPQQELCYEARAKLPAVQKAFRMGDAEYSRNCWTVYNEKWIKVSEV